MNIDNIIWLRNVVDKIVRKHNVMPEEVEQIFDGLPQFRFIEKGKTKGEECMRQWGRPKKGVI